MHRTLPAVFRDSADPGDPVLPVGTALRATVHDTEGPVGAQLLQRLERGPARRRARRSGPMGCADRAGQRRAAQAPESDSWRSRSAMSAAVRRSSSRIPKVRRSLTDRWDGSGTVAASGRAARATAASQRAIPQEADGRRHRAVQAARARCGRTAPVGQRQGVAAGATTRLATPTAHPRVGRVSSAAAGATRASGASAIAAAASLVARRRTAPQWSATGGAHHPKTREPARSAPPRQERTGVGPAVHRPAASEAAAGGVAAHGQAARGQAAHGQADTAGCTRRGGTRRGSTRRGAQASRPARRIPRGGPYEAAGGTTARAVGRRAGPRRPPRRGVGGLPRHLSRSRRVAGERRARG